MLHIKPQLPNGQVQQIAATPVPQPNPIVQTAYATPSIPLLLSESQASPELHQPWDIQVFVNPKTQSEYRLVSDTQPAAAAATTTTSPPPASEGSLLNTIFAPQAKRATTNTSTGEPSPMKGIGRNLLHEFRPSNDRKWSQNHAVLQTADFHGNQVTVRNVRYSRYESEDKYATQYYDATFNLDDVRSIDLIMVPFRGAPRLAHVESSFGFADGRQLAMSIEARYEENEKYDPIGAGLRQFELIYVFADERDMIRLGTDVNKNDVFIYRLKFEPNEVRTMFIDALQRANKLAEKPEFYHPLTNSCVTNLITHINKGRPKAVPKEYRTLVPGLLDHYVFDLKLVDTAANDFKVAKENAKVNWLVEKYGDLEYFSAGIRQNQVIK
jgi:hypothetical protein